MGTNAIEDSNLMIASPNASIGMITSYTSMNSRALPVASSQSHFLHFPRRGGNLFTQCFFLTGTLVGTGLGSTQISPNHCFSVHVVLVVVVILCVFVAVGDGGGLVIAWLFVVVLVSGHPKKNPGVQSSIVVGDAAEEDFVGSSRQPPKNPGCLHVEVDVLVAVDGEVVILDVYVVVSSRQPNQPGVIHVLVVLVVVVVNALVLVWLPVVVDSSKQPHHPGVLHVSVRVLVLLLVEDELVVVSELLLLYRFQRGQSTHSGVATHFGTVS